MPTRSRRTLRSEVAHLTSGQLFIALPTDISVPDVPAKRVKREHELGVYAALYSRSAEITEEWLRAMYKRWLQKRDHDAPAEGTISEVQGLGAGSRQLPPLALLVCTVQGSQVLLVNAVNKAIAQEDWLELGLILREIELWYSILHQESAERPWWELEAASKAAKDQPPEVVHLDVEAESVALDVDTCDSEQALHQVEQEPRDTAAGMDIEACDSTQALPQVKQEPEDAAAGEDGKGGGDGTLTKAQKKKLKEKRQKERRNAAAADAAASHFDVSADAGIAAEGSSSENAAARVFNRAELVYYVMPDGNEIFAQILEVHRETDPPHYTIMCDGREKQTEANRLRPFDAGAATPAPTPAGSSEDPRDAVDEAFEQEQQHFDMQGMREACPHGMPAAVRAVGDDSAEEDDSAEKDADRDYMKRLRDGSRDSSSFFFGGIYWTDAFIMDFVTVREKTSSSIQCPLLGRRVRRESSDRPDLIGTVGRATSFDVETGKYRVFVFDSGKCYNLPPKKISAIGEPTVSVRLPEGMGEAAARGETDRVMKWLDEGGHVDARDGEEHDCANLLMAAAEGGSEDLVRRLINRGACVNLQDACGVSPLSTAALHGHWWAVEDLLLAGADPLLENSDGSTAMGAAKSGRNGYNDFFSRLVMLDSVLQGAVNRCAFNHIACIRMLQSRLRRPFNGKARPAGVNEAVLEQELLFEQWQTCRISGGLRAHVRELCKEHQLGSRRSDSKRRRDKRLNKWVQLAHEDEGRALPFYDGFEDYMPFASDSEQDSDYET